MKQREINVYGKISPEGKLQLQMSAQPFLKEWANNKVIVSFKIIGGEPSEALKGYYFHCVVPTMKQALWQSGERMTEQETDKFLRTNSPITNICDYKNGHFETTIKEINELCDAELVEFIEYIKQMAAEEFSIYIVDPKTFKNV